MHPLYVCLQRLCTQWLIFLCTALSLTLTTGLAAYAQTGPGGVGNAGGTDGQPQNALWLRPDQGVTSNGSGITEWQDQSGNGNTARAVTGLGQPQLTSTTGVLGGLPVPDFRASDKDLFEVDETTELDNTDELTVVSIVYPDILDDNPRGVFAKRFDFDNTNPRNDAQYAYSGFFFNNDEFNFDVAGTGSQRNAASPVSASTGYLIQNRYARSEGESQIFIDGDLQSTQSFTTSIGDEPSLFRIGILKNGDPITDATNANRFYDGRIGEVIVYRTALNAAQRTIVNTYLTQKYSLPTTGAEVRSLDYAAYSTDIGGIGRETASEQHEEASSSVLGFGVGGGVDASGFSSDEQYVFIGHDGGAQDDFSSSSFSEPIQGSTVDAARIDRTWRADLNFNTGAGPKSITFTVHPDSLPGISSGEQYFVVVDDASNNFDGAVEAYTLSNNGGMLTTTADISEGDYIAIAAGRRAVNLSPTAQSVFENESSSPNVVITAQLNLPYTSSTNPEVTGSGVSVDITVATTGNVDGSPEIEDDGITNASGTNADGLYEADDGSGNDTAGSFNGDYRLSSSNPVSIPAGSKSATVEVEIDDDGIAEQTERAEVTLSNVTNAAQGPEARSVFDINDDDDPRDLTIVDGDDNTSKLEDNTAVPESFTVELDPDGNGETAATGAPFTRVDFVVDEVASSARPGVDLSDPTIDFRIVDEGGTPGDEFQERLSPTRGRVYFASGASTAEIKLEVNQDGIDDADLEDIVINLTNPVSAALSQDPGNTDLVFTIEDDDAAPTVQFSQSSSANAEDTDGAVEIVLSAPSGQPVIVDVAVDNGASTATEGAGDDFVLPRDTVRFATGVTSRLLPITVNDDAIDESDETVVLTLEGNGSAATRPTFGATVGTASSHTYTIQDNDTPAIGTTGPGGVGRTDGTSALELWLQADDLALADGASVAEWPDASGNGNGATASGSRQPTFATSLGPSEANGRPLVRFDGSDDRLEGSLSKVGPVTYFSVARGNEGGANTSKGAIAEIYDSGGTSRNSMYLPGDELRYFSGSFINGSTTTNSGNQDSGFLIYGAQNGISPQNLSLRLNGAVDGSGTTSENGFADSYVVGDDQPGNDDFISGSIGEFIVFASELNTTRQTLVDNYLSAKYNIPLNTSGGAIDVYVGDESANGDYDRGVFGIGQETTSDFHSAAETDGLRFDLASGLENNDYALAGYSTLDNTVNTTDVAGPSGLVARMDRDWFVDVTDTGSTLRVDMTFDLSDAGLAPSVNPDPSNYLLLYRGGQTGTWTDITPSGGASTNDDQITFSGASVGSLGDGYYTLGTTDQGASPISGTAITIVGSSGDEGDATVGELGGDAGWRLIGPPVEGATAGDLISGSDTNGSVIEFTVAQGSMFYRWDDTAAGSPDPGDWSPINTASTAFQNGRGYLLFLFDDEGIPDADPLNPSITLDVATGTVPTSNVTVGDNTPASDPALNQDAALHVLANPFNEPYDLTSLEDGGGNSLSSSPDFQNTIQIWDGGATTAEDGAQAGSYETATVNGTPSQDGTGNMVLQSSGSDVISAWQGFIVERSTPGAGSQQLTFNTAGLTTGDRRIVGSKSTSAAPFVRVPLKLTVASADGRQIARDEAASIYFHPDATDGWDAFDASKLTPLTRRYALLGPVGALRDTAAAPAIKAQESRSADVEDIVTVPLALQTVGEVRGQATVDIPDWSDIPSAWSLTLIDTQGTPDTSDDTEQPLTRTSSYAFTLDAAAKQGAQTASVMQATGEGQTAGEGARSPSLPRGWMRSCSLERMTQRKATRPPPRALRSASRPAARSRSSTAASTPPSASAAWP